MDQFEGGDAASSIKDHAMEERTQQQVARLVPPVTSPRQDSQTTAISILQSKSSLPPVIPPPPPQQVLEEEAYLNAVSSIIQRDFYPSLTYLRRGVGRLRKAAFDSSSSLAASLVASSVFGDETPAPGMYRGTAGGMGAATPALTNPSWTPLHDSANTSSVGSRTIGPSNHSTPEEAISLKTNLPLDAFQAKYTSEDNASFQQILTKESEERKRKYSWAFSKEGGRLLLTNTPASADASTNDNSPLSLTNAAKTEAMEWKGKSKLNNLLLFPNGAPRTMADIPILRGEAKAINHRGTRLAPSSNLTASDAGGIRVAQSFSLATPGFDFVPSTPLIRPHDDIDPSELMTWGEIEGTPLLLDRQEDGSTPALNAAFPDDYEYPEILGADGLKRFRIADTPKRDVLAHQLAERASRSLRHRVSSSTPVPISSSPALSMISTSTVASGKSRTRPAIGITSSGKPMSAAALHLLQRSTGRSVNSSPRLLNRSMTTRYTSSSSSPFQ